MVEGSRVGSMARAGLMVTYILLFRMNLICDIIRYCMLSDFASSNDAYRGQKERNCLNNLVGLHHLNFVDKSWHYWEQPRP
jgi:hypothetical protein